MLATEFRLTASDDFRRCVRQGVRYGRPTVVIHARETSLPNSRAGFVVSKAVGNAVVRNRVKRRLRHMVAGVVSRTDRSLDLVVRALPGAATGALAKDFQRAFTAVQERAAL